MLLSQSDWFTELFSFLSMISDSGCWTHLCFDLRVTGISTELFSFPSLTGLGQ